MPSKSYDRFNANLETVIRLEEEYNEAKKRHHSKGKRALDHITRSAIVFLVSSFEVYCEDVIRECCDRQIVYAKDADKLPHGVRNTINEYVMKSSNGCPPLRLCDEGWRSVYKDIVQNRTERLNTPDTKNLKKLFFDLLGVPETEIDSIPNISKLDDLIVFRGEVVHRVKANSYVSNQVVIEYKNFINDLVIKLEDILCDYFCNTYMTKQPWRKTHTGRKKTK